MRFGNWQVTVNSIEWIGSAFGRFVIPINELGRLRRSGDNLYYEWILMATDEDWLTQNDLYDLNYAFVYAIAKAGLAFDYDVFDATLAEQYDQFEAEDNEDDFEL